VSALRNNNRSPCAVPRPGWPLGQSRGWSVDLDDRVRPCRASSGAGRTAVRCR
jgi:hypothetical protein